MTNRITHSKLLPKNVAYWDYYILCRLNVTSALALQRMEYWDGTKVDSNLHNQQINEHLEAAGKPATQDTSRFVFKSHEELSWELIGCCCERTLPAIMDMLLTTLHYLTWRNNPYNSLDHTRQYCFQAKLVQSHLNRLSSIVEHFLGLGREASCVLYAIEQLTAEGYYIAQMDEKDGSVFERTDVELLSIERVAKKLQTMHEHMREDERLAQQAKAGGKKCKYRLPRFIRLALKKDEAHGFPSEEEARDGKIAVSTQQNCGTETAKLPQRDSKVAGTIPVITPVITYNDYTQESGASSAPPTRDAAGADIAAYTLDFSSLLAAVSTLPHEQRQQLAQALLGPSSLLQSEKLEPSHHPDEDPALVPNQAQQAGAPQPLEQHDLPQHDSMQRVTDILPTASPGSTLSSAACSPEAERTSRRRSGRRKHLGSGSSSNPSMSQDIPELEDTTVPLVEPEMTGEWNPEKVVQYAESKVGKRYRAKARQKQLDAAVLIHAVLPDMTLAQFKQAYDDRDDVWWHQHNGKLHITDLAAADKSGEMRVITALERLKARHQTRPTGERSQACTTLTQKPSSVQLQLEAAAPGFQFLSQVELMKLPLEERRAYNARLRAHMGAHKEQQQQATAISLQIEPGK